MPPTSALAPASRACARRALELVARSHVRMPASAPIRTRRWQAIGITVVVGAMALGAAAGGLVVRARVAAAPGPDRPHRHRRPVEPGRSPSTATRRAPCRRSTRWPPRASTFTRAYAHTPQTLPGYTTLLTGRLPFEHGVRDDGGFVLRPEVRTLAELLRNRGFATGGAVSTFLLRSETGVAQGFSFFDGRFPETEAAVERDGDATAKTALAWLDSQSGQRFFMFVEAPRDGRRRRGGQHRGASQGARHLRRRRRSSSSAAADRRRWAPGSTTPRCAWPSS